MQCAPSRKDAQRDFLCAALRLWRALLERRCSVTCERCKRAIAQGDRSEPYSVPSDGRRVHSACVGELLSEVLALMANVPENVRLCEEEP